MRGMTQLVPCEACGRPAAVGARCERCDPTARWTIRAPSGEVTLDRAGVAAALREGKLGPTDPVLLGNGRSVPLAAHGPFQAMFLPGHAAHVDVPSAPAAASPGWLKRLLLRSPRAGRT